MSERPSMLLTTLYVEADGIVHAHAGTLQDGRVQATVEVTRPDHTQLLRITTADDLDALERLGNELIRAANIGRALAPARAAAPDGSPGAAVTPRAAAPGEPNFGPEYDCSRPGLHRGPWDGQTCRACGYSAPAEPEAVIW